MRYARRLFMSRIKARQWRGTDIPRSTNLDV